jgi:hypothetical protein
MKYGIYVRRHDGAVKLSALECEADDRARQLSLYLFRHYPVSFFDDVTDAAGDMEKVLKDSRTGMVVWREGDTSCKIEEGEFYIEALTELDIQDAWKSGFSEGYAKDVEDGREQGYRQGVRDKARASILK